MITRPALAHAHARAADVRALRVSRIDAVLAHRLEGQSRALGRVHSVFPHAVNVLDRDERLLTLHGPGPLAAPFAMALEAELSPGTLTPGMAVERVGMRLVVGRSSVDWAQAARVDTRLPSGHEHETLVATLLGNAPRADWPTVLPAGGGALHTPLAVEAQGRVVRGIALGDARIFAAGALSLIGLGEGLTPAGDDWLVGALAVVHRLRPAFLSAHPDVARDVAAAAREGTTLVAREFLVHATDGRFSETVIALVSAAHGWAARQALARLLSTGATSGADTAAGMRAALEAIARSDGHGAISDEAAGSRAALVAIAHADGPGAAPDAR